MEPRATTKQCDQRAVRLVPRFLRARLKLLLELGTEALAAKDFAGEEERWGGSGWAREGEKEDRDGADADRSTAAANPPRRKGTGGRRRSAASGGRISRGACAVTARAEGSSWGME